MKRIFYFLVLIAAITIQSMAAEAIKLSLKDTTVIRGSTFLYAVMVESSLTGHGVTAYEVDINYDGNAFDIASIIIGGTLTQGWGTPTYNDFSTHITIAGAGTTSLDGTGVLFYLELLAPLSSTTWGSSFQFAKAVLNEGTPPTTTRNGTIWISNPPSISVYPDNATLSIGDQQQFWLSSGVPPYQWSLTNPSVASIDTNGLLKGLHAGYTRVIAQDSRAIIDTSGQIEIRPFKMIIRDTSFLQGQTFNIPIYVSDLSEVDVTAGQFWITYDPNMLTFLEDIEVGTLLATYPKPTIRSISNRLEISFAGSSRLNGIGTQVLMYLRFRATIQYTGSAWLNISNLLFNENLLGTIDDGYVYISSRTVLTVNPSSANILVGDTIQFVVGGSPVGPVRWSLNDSSLATITQTGLLQATHSGTVIVNVADTIGKIGYSGNINVFDIRVTMPDTSGLSRDSFIVPIHITEYTPGFTAAQMIVKFDTAYFENPSVITEGTLTNSQEVYSFARGETLSIATANSVPLTGPGVLWKIKFFVRYSAPKLSTSTIRMIGVVFNEGVPKPLIEDCNFYIRWERDVMVEDILAPVGTVSRDSVIIPRARVRNVRDINQSFKAVFKIGSLYSDTVNVMLGAWATMDITFSKSWTAAPSGTHVLRCEALLPADQDTSNNTAIRNLAVIRTSTDPVILNMTPNHSGNYGIATSFIHGQNFRTGAKVILKKSGHQDYNADSLYTRVIDPTKIIVVFDFYGEALGTWDVFVMNPDSGSTTFYDGFTLELPTKQLWSTIIGPDRVRIGREQTFTVMYGNTGNVDAVGVLLMIRGIPKNVTWKMDFSFAPSPTPDSINWNDKLGFIETETEKIIPIWLPLLRANQTRDISFSIKIPWGTPSFTISSGINETEAHLYVPSSTASWKIDNYLGTQDINWQCVTAIGALIGNIAGVIIPNNCIGLGINAFTTISSIIAADELDGYSYLQMISSTVKDALFCAGETMGGPISTAIKVASVVTDLIASGSDIYQKCWPDPKSKLPIQPVAAIDPNHKSGPVGHDTTTNYTTLDRPFFYMIEFENLPAATAEAETVFVRDTLDSNLDWSTLQFHNTSHPQFQTIQVDSTSRSILWTYGGINLPPNVNPPEGQGWTTFSILPKNNLPSGTLIKNSASIVFDYNPPLVTNVFVNTIDSGKPSSNVLALQETTSTGEFIVKWTGRDDTLGSGIAAYDIYVKYDDGSYTSWLIGTKDTVALFVGDNERVHSFYSIAIDNVGLREDVPSIPDAVTYVTGVSPPIYLSPSNEFHTNNSKPKFSWSRTAGIFGNYTFEYALDSLFSINVQTVNNITDTTFTIVDSLSEGIYYWHVEAISGSGSHSGYRTPYQLTIDTQSPMPPTLLSLKDSAAVNDTTPMFKWTKTAGDGGKYLWECATDNSFDSLVAAYYTSDTIFTVLDHMALNNRIYYWHVRAIDKALNTSNFQDQPYQFTIDTSLTSVFDEEQIPTKFALYQNYPNPFNPKTKIRYELPVASRVKLTIYNILGQEVITLVDETETVGHRIVEWNATNNRGLTLGSGVYFYKLEATNIDNPKNKFTQIKKLLLLK